MIDPIADTLWRYLPPDREKALAGLDSFGSSSTWASDFLQLETPSKADPSKPARTGETVIVYCTGLGPVSANVDPGSPAPPQPSPKNRTSIGCKRPAGKGRCSVRRIKASLSRSRNWLRALAPAATNEVPMSVCSSTARSGMPPAANQVPVATVNRTSTMTRGLVSSR